MAQGPSPNKRRKPNYTETFEVVVRVSPAQRKFSVYTETLCRRSKFFEASRSMRRNTEDAKKPVELVDHDAHIFESYLEVVYTGKLSTCFRSDQLDEECSDIKDEDDEDYDEDDDEDDGGNGHWIRTPDDALDLVKFYVLADKLGDLVSGNLVLDTILRLSDLTSRVPGENALKYAYENTAPGNHLRKLLVDYYVYEAGRSNRIENRDAMGEFLFEVWEEFRKTKHNTGLKNMTVKEVFSISVSDWPQCHYHQHDAEHPASKCAEPK